MKRKMSNREMKKIITILLICCLGAFSLACLAVAADEQGSQTARAESRNKTDAASGNAPVTEKITSEGQSLIHSGDIDAARIAALRAAYADAVSRATGEDVRNYLLTRNIRRMAEIVMKRANGYIHSYRITGEVITEAKFDQPGSYKVVIAADAGKAADTDDEETGGLKQFLALMGNPKILIMFQEQSGGAEGQSEKSGGAGRESALKSGEAAIAQAFSQYGYQMITSDDLAASGFVNLSILQKQYSDENVADVIKIARAAGADLAIIGTIRFGERPVKPLGLPMTMISAEVSAKVLITNTGKSVDAFHVLERASAPDKLRARSDCLDKLATGIAESMARKIPLLLTEESREMKLMVQGADISLGHRIKESLEKSLAGVLVRFTRMPIDGSDTAEYSIMTGFITLTPGEILAACGKDVADELKLIRANKYEVVLKFDRP
jgi:hypothetical protein